MSNWNQRLNAYIHSLEYENKMIQEEEKNKEIIDFVNKYPKEVIKKLTPKKYAGDLRKDKSFCYHMDIRLSDHGNLSNRLNPYQKFVLYFNNKEKKYMWGNNKQTKLYFGDNTKDILNNIKKYIIDIIDASKRNDYEAIARNPLGHQFKNKLAYIYSGFKQIPMYSDENLNIVLNKLDIKFNKKDTRAQKRNVLYEFYKDNVAEVYKISPWMFTNFLYSKHGYRDELQPPDQEIIPVVKPKETFTKLDKLQLIESEEEKPSKSKGGAYKAVSETRKKEIGVLGENKVIDYLKSHASSFNLKEESIKTPCLIGPDQDDTVGYDISYETNDERFIMVEVKSTTRTNRNNIYFEMSSNEYDVMLQNLDNYYVFYVSDADNASNIDIQEISGRTLYEADCFKPSKYRVSLKTNKEN